MAKVRAVYASKMEDWVGEKDIQTILEASRRNNQRNGLTGLLCFGSRQFLQCLEGEREMVNRTYREIIRDPRHHAVELLSYEDIDELQFGEWLMAYVPESSLSEALLTEVLGQRKFLPFALNSQSAAAFLTSVKEHVPAI